MTSVSRRRFIVGGSAGALGATGAAVLARTGIAGASGADEADLSAQELEAAGQPALLRVRDAATGQLELLVDEQEIVFTDKRLVARVLRAMR